MAFMELQDLGDDFEDVAVPEGTYHVRIRDAKVGQTKAKDRDMITCQIDIEDQDYPNAATIFHYVCFPKADDKESTHRLMMQGMSRFLATFGMDRGAGGFDPEDLVGAEADVLLVQEEYEGDVKNTIKFKRI